VFGGRQLFSALSRSFDTVRGFDAIPREGVGVKFGAVRRQAFADDLQ